MLLQISETFGVAALGDELLHATAIQTHIDEDGGILSVTEYAPLTRPESIALARDMLKSPHAKRRTMFI